MVEKAPTKQKAAKPTKKRVRRRSRRSEYKEKQDQEIVRGSERYPVFEPLADEMKVELIVGKNEQVCIVHDQKLAYVLKWVEFDEKTKTLTLVSQKGQLQPLGLDIPAEMFEYLLDIDDIAVVLKPEDKIKDIYIASFIFVDDLFNVESLR